MLPEHGTLNRGYYLGKYWKKLGHEPIVFTGSHPHNTDLQLIEDNSPFKVYQKKPFPWVLIKTRNYGKSKKQQILSMLEFCKNTKKAVKRLQRPDVIVGSSAHPLAALLAIQLAKKYKCKSVVEIRDLWPESIVAYGILPKNNPIIKLMYLLEKYLYVHADEINFTMAGGYDYIIDKGWEDVIPKSKVHNINNGIDLELFENNRETYKYNDPDLDNPEKFCVIYTGAIKMANNIGILLDVAKKITNSNVVIMLFGDGDQLDELKKRVKEEKIDNVRLMGRVEKKYIPSILEKGDLDFIHLDASGLLKYGLSLNKMFDYFASGSPVLISGAADYSPVKEFNAGTELEKADAKMIADEIERYSLLSKEAMNAYRENALKAAQAFSYENLARDYAEFMG